MASTFEIQARQRWTFPLVLLGSRLQLEGWCDHVRCAASVHPRETPRHVAHTLMEHPSCCLGGD